MIDLDLMQGEWAVESLIQDGRPAYDAPLHRGFVIEGDQLTIRLFLPGSKEIVELVHRVELDEWREPKRIVLHELGKSDWIAGIYELDGDSLRFCWGREFSDVPPADFSADAGSDRRLFVLKRRRAAG